ncbi:MAG: flagellar basal body rod protein FlgB [Epulopiscium sp.]|nr:flagellar basal body rod protein FlgB [Candidatus Epulonipiscium sp.]
MFNRLYSNTNILEKALDASWLRNDTIADNIANVDTPGYKRKEVEFEKYLEKSMAFNKSPSKVNIENIQPRMVMANDKLQTRMDENNVDIDVEMTEMAKNSIRYNTLISQVSAEFKRINIVLNSR